MKRNPLHIAAFLVLMIWSYFVFPIQVALWVNFALVVFGMAIGDVIQNQKKEV